MRVSDITRKLEKKFPRSNAESWDNVGLLVGRGDHEVRKVQISLDATERVIDKAIEDSVDLIITHHPLIFNPLKAISDSSTTGRKVLKLIENGVALYSMHTNLDSSPGGLNEYIAEILGLEESRIIDEENYEMYSMSVYVPVEWCSGAIKKIEDSGLQLKGYEGVSYTSNTEERYREADTNTLHINECKKISVIGEKGKLYQVLGDIKKIHPYEEVAYEIVRIENKYVKNGIGRYADMGEEKNILEAADEIKEKLGIKSVRIVSEDVNRRVKRVAVVNGSGMSFFRKLKRLKVDLFITGDVKYHEGLDALEEGISVIDVGHYESEHFFHKLISRELAEVEGLDVRVFNDEPVFKYV